MSKAVCAAFALVSFSSVLPGVSGSTGCAIAQKELKAKTDSELLANALEDFNFKPHSFLESRGIQQRLASDEQDFSNASAHDEQDFSRYCNKVKGGGIEFICPPGFHAHGKGICKLKSKRSHTGSDPSHYVLPTKKTWPNALWGTVKAGDPTTTGHYEYKTDHWLTNGIAVELCAGGSLMNSGKACLDHCSKVGAGGLKETTGFCDSYCGHGNACCQAGNPTDPEECQGVPASVYGHGEHKVTHHTCVKPKQSDDVMWYADSTCHINQGETCFQTCNKVGRACDANSFKKINNAFHVQRAANQAGLTCASFSSHSGTELFKGPWIGHSNLECGYHTGASIESSCAVTQECDKSLICPCKGNFIAHNPGEQKCPPGYKFIIDKNLCKDAASLIKAKENVKEKHGHFGTNGPVGCFLNPGTGHVSFNKDNTGSEVAMDGMQYVCMGEDSSYMSTGNQQNECPEGYMRIKDKHLCLAAGKELHPEAQDGITTPGFRVKNSPHEPNGCFYKLHAATDEHAETERIYLNLPTLPGNMLHEGESLICMSEEVMAEIEAKKAELAEKNFPQKGHCAPGFEDEDVSLPSLGSCHGSWLTGHCVLPPGEAKVMCDKTPECAGISETTDVTWLKNNPGMQQLGKLPKDPHSEYRSEWKTCIKGPQPDPCEDHEVMNGTEMAKLAASPATAAAALAETGAALLEMNEVADVQTMTEEEVERQEEEVEQRQEGEEEVGVENGHDELVVSSDADFRPPRRHATALTPGDERRKVIRRPIIRRG